MNCTFRHWKIRIKYLGRTICCFCLGWSLGKEKCSTRQVFKTQQSKRCWRKALIKQGLTSNLPKDANYYLQKCFWALRAVQILFWLTVRCLISSEIFLISSDSIFNLIKSSSLLLNHQTLVLQYRLRQWTLEK